MTLPQDLSPQAQLFLGIAFSDRLPEYGQAITQALERGASLSLCNTDGNTPLTAAILDGMGSPLAVKMLLEQGANPEQVDQQGWCPWAACQARKHDRVVAPEMQQIEELLRKTGLVIEVQAPAPRTETAADIATEPTAAAFDASQYPAPYAELFAKHTNGINCDIDTEDIVKKLMDWDQRYGICFENVTHDGLLVHFKSLPGDADALHALGEEIYDFCPDVIDQGFGCMDDMLEMLEAQGLEIDEPTQTLIAGVDFEDENFGLELLARSLASEKQVSLWWD